MFLSLCLDQAIVIMLKDIRSSKSPEDLIRLDNAVGISQRRSNIYISSSGLAGKVVALI